MTLSSSLQPAALVFAGDSPSAVLAPRDLTLATPAELADAIRELEVACRERPNSAALWTCLGMAYAVNYDIDKSMDAFETAIAEEPNCFWAHLKYGELQYRLRVLVHAEAATLTAETLAANAWQQTLARRQLNDIRKLSGGRTLQPGHEPSTRTLPALLFSALIIAIAVATVWW